MSNLARKKPRTKENKPPVASRSDRVLPTAPQAVPTTVVEDTSALAPTDAPYVCTGRFGVDFVQLCRRAHLQYIPNVVARPHRPALASEDKKGAAGRKLSAKVASNIQLSTHVVADQSLASDGAAADGFIPEPPPKTYVLRDAISFFRPSVQVEVDKAEKGPVEQAAITELYIHGWKIDEVMVGILAECLPAVSSLHTLDLWNVGLSDITLDKLAALLPRCRALRTLLLDANPVNSQRWHLLLQDDSPVQHLSLRFCGITWLGAKYLGESLGGARHQNTRLLSLDLAGNRIADIGTSYLADALRLNRSLLVLNLAGNGLTDLAASELAGVLSAFELSHDEVVQRRRLDHRRRVRGPSRQLSGSKLTHRLTSGAHQRGRKQQRADHGPAKPGDRKSTRLNSSH